MVTSTAGAALSAESERYSGLGSLPDTILVLILSLVPTLDAVRCSVLSRRWRYLWTSVPALALDDRCVFFEQHDGRGTGKRKRGSREVEDPKSTFVAFVDRVLAFRHPPELRRFRLSCSGPGGVPVEDWVRAAVTRKARELDLRVRLGEGASLPPRLFFSHSLVELKLDLEGSELKLPATVGLVGLRSMHLRSVSFQDDQRASKLFSNCRALESLVMVDCQYHNLGNLEIYCPSLQRLTMDSPSKDDGLGNCELKISAPQLTSFKYRASLAQAFHLHCLSSLVDVKVQFRGFVYYGTGFLQNLTRVHAFLRQLIRTRKLKICPACAEVLWLFTGSPTPGRLSLPFSNLNALKVIVGGVNCPEAGLILSFLVASPRLRTLFIKRSEEPRMIPFTRAAKECYSKILRAYKSEQVQGSLERVEIRCQDDRETVLELAKVLLESQPHLGALQLSSQLLRDSNGQEFSPSQMRKTVMELSSFPRRSPSVVVAFF